MEVYVHSAGHEDPEVVQVAGTTTARELVQDPVGGTSIWIEDSDEPLSLEVTLDVAGLQNRGHIHRGNCHQVEVSVRFNGVTKSRPFSPANTVVKVLKWATGEKGFDLSAIEAAKHTLAVPGSDHPLDPRTHVGSLVSPGGSCSVLLDLLPKVRFEG
jgi:hypothetical protein